MSTRRRDNRSEPVAAAVSAFVYVNNEENGPTSLLKASELTKYKKTFIIYNCQEEKIAGLFQL